MAAFSQELLSDFLEKLLNALPDYFLNNFYRNFGDVSFNSVFEVLKTIFGKLGDGGGGVGLIILK